MAAVVRLWLFFVVFDYDCNNKALLLLFFYYYYHQCITANDR